MLFIFKQVAKSFQDEMKMIFFNQIDMELGEIEAISIQTKQVQENLSGLLKTCLVF